MKKQKKEKMGEKGVFAVAAAYFVFFVVLVLFFAIIIPSIELFNIKVWTSGDNIIAKAEQTASEINDVNMRTEFNNTIQSQKTASTDNVAILGAFNQWSWAIIAIIILGVYFLFARQVVETQSQV